MFKLFFGCALLAAVYGQEVFRGRCPEVTLQENFEINRYQGTWYELQRYFAIFEVLRDCVAQDYTVLENGQVAIRNVGTYKLVRLIDTASGVATIDPNEPAKLVFRPNGGMSVLSVTNCIKSAADGFKTFS